VSATVFYVYPETYNFKYFTTLPMRLVINVHWLFITDRS